MYVYVCARVSVCVCVRVIVSERKEERGGCLCVCVCVYLRACVKEREGEKKRVCSRRMGELCNKASRVFIDPCPMAFLLSHYCNNDLTDGPETFLSKKPFFEAETKQRSRVRIPAGAADVSTLMITSLIV